MHIQIILYNSLPHLPLLTKGLNAVNKNNEINVHFLENSQENSKEFIKKQRCEFDYTYDNENENLGFGKGHNFLFNKYKKGYDESFLILNPDTLPFFDFVEQLKLFIKKMPKNWGVIELAQSPEEHPKDYDENFETAFASGAATLFKTDVFKKVHGFDENIFMYAEDVDISWRIKESGYLVLHCPFSKIAHVIGGSSRNVNEIGNNKNSNFQEIHMHAGNLYLRYKFFGDNEVRKFDKMIKPMPQYKGIIKQYEEMKRKLTSEMLEKYRAYKSPEIQKDQNYGVHRW